MNFDNNQTILVKCDQHANLDSLPLRYGFSLEPELKYERKALKIFEIENLYSDRTHNNRVHLTANFHGPENQLCKGHIIIGRKEDLDGKDIFSAEFQTLPFLVTVWPERHGFTADMETELSATLKDMREKNLISVSDLITMHPKYLEGKITNYGDVINSLADIKAQKVIEGLKLNAFLKPQPGEKISNSTPMTLIDVNIESYVDRSGMDKENICLQFKESSIIRRNNWSKGFEARLELCRKFIGKKVFTDSWKHYDSNKWFQNIYQSDLQFE